MLLLKLLKHILEIKITKVSLSMLMEALFWVVIRAEMTGR